MFCCSLTMIKQSVRLSGLLLLSKNWIFQSSGHPSVHLFLAPVTPSLLPNKNCHGNRFFIIESQSQMFQLNKINHKSIRFFIYLTDLENINFISKRCYMHTPCNGDTQKRCFYRLSLITYDDIFPVLQHAKWPWSPLYRPYGISRPKKDRRRRGRRTHVTRCV